MMLDASRNPTRYFRFHPTHGPRADTHPAWEPALRFELVDHRTIQSVDPADLWQPQDLRGQRERGELIDQCRIAGLHLTKRLR